MSQNRSPSKSPHTQSVEINLCSRTIAHSGSTPNLTAIEHDNITTRLKRKREDDACCMDEIRTLLSQSAAQTAAKFTSLQASMADILAQNIEINKNISFISEKYDDMIVKLENLERDRKADRCHILQLEEKLDTLERQLYSTKLEIKNVPKKLEETKEDICEIVKDVAKALNTPIERHDIKDVFRVGKKDDAPTILVDFNSAYIKENLIKRARQFNNKNKEKKLNTTHLKLAGPAKPVYLSEKLTPKTYRIYYLARIFAKENNYKYCWTSFGKVLLRKMDGHKHVHINTEEDLRRLSQVK